MKPISFGVLLALCAASAFAQGPQIVESSPKFWETGVNPRLNVISVTFDQRLRHGFSSWLGAGSLLPESGLESSSSADGRVFSLTVNLAPGKVYAFALNEREIPGVGFQTTRGIPLRRHFLVFQTAGDPAPDDAPPRVVSTLPANGAQQLDPAKLLSASVTFDRPMNIKQHGLQLLEAGKPVDLASARFQYSADGRTFAIAYQFKPATSYEIVLNSVNNIGFASASQVPLWPLRFAFSTGQPQR